MSRQSENSQGFGHVELIIAAVIIAVLGFGVWRVIDANDTSDDQASSAEQELVDEAEELPTDLGTIKSVEEIQSQASLDAADKTVIGIELESEDGQLVYVVRFSDGSFVAYDAVSGESTEFSGDDDDEADESESIPSDFVAGISIQDALSIARAEVPDATVESVELEVEDGVVVYSVRFTDDGRVDVDAEDGAVLRTEVGDDDEAEDDADSDSDDDTESDDDNDASDTDQDEAEEDDSADSDDQDANDEDEEDESDDDEDDDSDDEDDEE